VELTRFALLTEQELRAFEKLFSDLAIVTQRTFRVAATLNALLRYATYPLTDTLPLAAYYTPTRVTVTLTRSERLGRYTIVPAISVSPPPAPAKGDEGETEKGGGASEGPGKKKSAGTNEEEKPKTATPTVPGAATPGLQVPTPLTPDGQPLPVVRINVLERYRYRFSVGLTRSWIDARTYEVTNDTLRLTGLAPTRVFPTAALSVAIYPFNGQFLANQANAWQPRKLKNLPDRLGLWAQLGLSLNDPTKQIFLGGATDPFPGITLAFGEHFGYVAKPTVAVDSKVPAGQTAIRNKWDNAFAATLTVDASVILSSFGALLGLK
jgi:hypothetical protein